MDTPDYTTPQLLPQRLILTDIEPPQNTQESMEVDETDGVEVYRDIQK